MAKRKKLDEDMLGMNFNEMFKQSMDSVVNPKDLPEQFAIPTGVDLLDTIIGGNKKGLLSGTYTSFCAPPGSGKSTICLNIEANFKRLFPEGFIIHIDSEQATTDERFRMLGIPLGKDERIWKISYGATVEEVFECLKNFIALKEKFACEVDESYRSVPTMFVWDSVDSSPTCRELEADSVENAIGQKPKQLGFFIKKYLRDFRKYNIAFVTINHIGKTLKLMGPYEQYDGTMAPLGKLGMSLAGGKAVSFYPSNLIFLRGHENTKKMAELINGKYGLPSAFLVSATTLKCKNFSYNITVDLIFDTMRGFDDFTTKMHNMLMDENYPYILSEGRSFTFKNYPGDKFKIEEIRNNYVTDAEFKRRFDESWEGYKSERFGEFIKVLNQLTERYNNIDISGVTQNIDLSVLQDIANSTNSSSENIEEDNEMRQAIFETAEEE